MGISGISGSTSYDEWALIQAQKEKDQKSAEQSGTVGTAQVTAAANTDQSLSESQKVLNVTNTDTVEISSEGRAYQQSLQAATSSVASAATSETSEAEASEQSLEAAQEAAELSTASETSEAEASQQSLAAGGGSKPSSAATSETSEDSSYTDLTTLTEDEIEDLVDEGTITEAEANAELARRAALEQKEKASTDETAETAQTAKTEETDETDETVASEESTESIDEEE